MGFVTRGGLGSGTVIPDPKRGKYVDGKADEQSRATGCGMFRQASANSLPTG